MKTLRSLLQKAQGFVGGSWMKVLVITMVLSAPIMPGNVPVVGPTVVQAQGSAMPDGEAAVSEFSELFRKVRTFAGILLLIAVVVAGILFVAGKQNAAILVFVGAVIVFGGAYVIGLVNGAFNET